MKVGQSTYQETVMSTSTQANLDTTKQNFMEELFQHQVLVTSILDKQLPF